LSNAKPDFPPRSEIAKKFDQATSGEAINPGGTSAGKKLLEVLAGDEAISIAMEVDFVAWPEAEAAKPAAAQNPNP